MKQMNKTMENHPMNQDIFAGQWKQIRGELKSWWGKLADNDCDRIGGQKDKLVGMVQEKYGYAREQAQQEVDRRLEEYSDKMSGPNASGKRGAAAAGAGVLANAPHEGPIATTIAAVAGGLEAVEGAISTGWESAQGAVSTAATAVTGGLESAQGAVSTAATAVAGGLGSAQGAVSTAATAVADGLGSASSYLQEKEFAEMATDLTALVRRYPVQSLLVGMGLGYILARLTSR
jgi:uncharacterized protein YjbJ (UPF0337 family)